MQIPFLDLNKINAAYESEFQSAWNYFLKRGQYILGAAVASFENEFAAYCGAKYCIGTGNGLDALSLILKGYLQLGKLQQGDGVLVAANTYIATIIAIKNAGLVPVLIDANESSFNLDPKLLPPTPNKNVKAILVTHLYGQLADMGVLHQYCAQHNLLLIDDAAQAHGAENKQNIKAGNLADASAFSFYPTKNLGALGDAGAVTTSNDDLAKVIQKLRNYGKDTNVTYDYIGVNSRLDEIQAAFLNVKLKNLNKDNDYRREIANYYIENITNPKINLPTILNWKSHVFHQFVIRVEKREDFINYLKKNGIGSGIHYPLAPHQQKAFVGYFKGNYPVTEKLANEIVSLPMNTGLEKNEIKYIVEKINNY